jgi:hypothetical protein
MRVSDALMHTWSRVVDLHFDVIIFTNSANSNYKTLMKKKERGGENEPVAT